MMRLFIAINFDEETKDRIVAVQERLHLTAGGNFSHRENLHLTLAFLGELDNARAETVCRIMKTLDVPEMELEFSEVGCFRRDRGDIWWIGIKKHPQLFSLQKELTDKLRRFGFDIEERRFTPHITLCRETISAGRIEKDELLPQKFTAKVSSVQLMLSQRINGRLTYTPKFSVSK